MLNKFTAVLLLSWSLLGTVAAAELSAHQVVEQTMNRISAELDGRRDELTANKSELYALVNRELLPKFDVDYAGRLVLGKSWRTATPAQREQFVDVFYNFLLRSYASAILKFEQDNIRFLPPRNPPKDGRTVVQTEMRMPEGTVVPVYYSMRQTADGWRAFDVRIEGISYVQNYRNQFNAEVAAKGLDALIGRLEKETADIDAGLREPEPVGPAAAKPRP